MNAPSIDVPVDDGAGVETVVGTTTLVVVVVVDTTGCEDVRFGAGRHVLFAGVVVVRVVVVVVEVVAVVEVTVVEVSVVSVVEVVPVSVVGESAATVGATRPTASAKPAANSARKTTKRVTAVLFGGEAEIPAGSTLATWWERRARS